MRLRLSENVCVLYEISTRSLFRPGSRAEGLKNAADRSNKTWLGLLRLDPVGKVTVCRAAWLLIVSAYKAAACDL